MEFLNGQMPGIEVLAVEIKQFRGKSTQTLVPRVIGRTAASSASGTARGTRLLLTRESFLDGFASDEARSVASRLLDVAQESGGTLQWGSSSVSIRMSCSVWRQPITIA